MTRRRQPSPCRIPDCDRDRQPRDTMCPRHQALMKEAGSSRCGEIDKATYLNGPTAQWAAYLAGEAPKITAFRVRSEHAAERQAPAVHTHGRRAS